jgi:excisionase family DNA binding protein
VEDEAKKNGGAAVQSGPTFRFSEKLLLPFSPQKTISISKAAELLDCSHDTVSRLVEAGTLKAYRLRNRSPYRVFYDSFVDYLDSVHAEAGIDPRYRR